MTNKIITFIPKNYETNTLYALEEEITILIKNCAQEIEKIYEIPESERYEKTIPTELYAILCSYGKHSEEPAILFLTSRGFKINKGEPK